MLGPSSEPQRRLRLYAERRPDGEVYATYLVRSGDLLAFFADSTESEKVARALPAGALPAVLRRYGKPLEDGLDPTSLLAPEGVDEDDTPMQIPLPGGGHALLRRFRFLPYGWVHPADYLLWEEPGQESLAAPAPLVGSALAALSGTPKQT